MKIQHKNKILSLDTPKIMGILNVTPDSFSDGGHFNQQDAALAQVDAMIANGAAIIDVGGESTRPGAAMVSEQEELDRVLPIIEAIATRFDVWISIDTSKARVMTEGVNAGANLINDVRALQMPGALRAATLAQVPICLMHMQGQPKNMQHAPSYHHVIDEVMAFFESRIDACLNAGIKRSALILDPGFGFGKTMAHNFLMIEQFNQFSTFSLPLLAGLSRKSMFDQLLTRKVDQRLASSLAGALLCAQQGAGIIRVHDVKETADVLAVLKMTNFCQ
ncbi:MAG: dihydropteroate synthase [Psychrobium sp.]|nr:dihydropteroate synthase [Psychrobium sp.]